MKGKESEAEYDSDDDMTTHELELKGAYDICM
jgi:hypothetical protein